MSGFTKCPSAIQRPLTQRPLVPLGAFVAIVLLSHLYSSASISDDFETYPAGSIAGQTYTPSAGGTNAWSVSTSGTATVTNDGTAYSGNNYLRLGDTSTTAATAAYDKFLTTPESPDGTLSISFALRPSSTYNQINAIFYGYQSGATPSTPTALELGIAGNSAGTEAEFDWYTGGTVVTGTSPNNPGTKNVSGYLAPTAPNAIVAGHWYLFNVTAGGSSASNNFTPTYSFTVTDETTATVVLSESGLAATTLGSAAYDNISEFSVQTTSAGTGNADLDAFAITDVAAPEPSCLAILALGSVGVLRRRVHSRRVQRQPQL